MARARVPPAGRPPGRRSGAGVRVSPLRPRNRRLVHRAACRPRPRRAAPTRGRALGDAARPDPSPGRPGARPAVPVQVGRRQLGRLVRGGRLRGGRGGRCPRVGGDMGIGGRTGRPTEPPSGGRRPARRDPRALHAGQGSVGPQSQRHQRRELGPQRDPDRAACAGDPAAGCRLGPQPGVGGPPPVGGGGAVAGCSGRRGRDLRTQPGDVAPRAGQGDDGGRRVRALLRHRCAPRRGQPDPAVPGRGRRDQIRLVDATEGRPSWCSRRGPEPGRARHLRRGAAGWRRGRGVRVAGRGGRTSPDHPPLRAAVDGMAPR
jgi:hypothetical protein